MAGEDDALRAGLGHGGLHPLDELRKGGELGLGLDDLAGLEVLGIKKYIWLCLSRNEVREECIHYLNDHFSVGFIEYQGTVRLLRMLSTKKN